MTDAEINAAIAEVCGINVKAIEEANAQKYRDELRGIQVFGASLIPIVPNYCHDLNAMHEVEETLTSINGMPEQYGCILSQTVLQGAMTLGITARFRIVHATAHQRAEAFLRVKGKWKDA